MPCKTIPVAQNIAITQLGVKPSAALLAIAQQQGIPVQVPPTVWANAVVDTGCSDTAVTAQVAQQAGLLLVGQVVVQTPAGQVVSNIYYGDLLLTYNVGNVAIAWTFPNRFISQIQAGGPN
ncbi:MAG: hypothetical protein ACREHE_14095, partial [Rhizomicrobium sp.]